MRPPVIELPRSEAERNADRISTAAAAIRRAWPHMLPTEAPAIQYRTGRSSPAGILASPSHPEHDTTGRAYHADDWTPTVATPSHRRPTEDDIDGMTRLLSLRRHVTETLNGWCRVVMEDRPVTSAKALPLGSDVPGMCEFLERHATWLGPQDYADDCASEIEAYGRRVVNVVDPPKRERHTLGRCPFVVEGDLPDVYDRTCQGVVSIPIGGDQDEAACSECGQSAVVEWWEEVLGRSRREVATIPQLVPILRARLHVEVSERTLRRWASRLQITPIQVPVGPQPRHRRFEVRDVLDEVARMGRECVVCGQPWHGRSDVCTRCIGAVRDARPSVADDSQPYPLGSVVVQSRPLAATAEGLLTLREHLAVRCEETGSPQAWCACGRHG